MRISSKSRLQLLVQNSLFVVLLAALVMLLSFFAHEYRVERDITQNRRSTLTQPARDALTKLAGPVKITAYATRQDARGDVRKSISDFLKPYQRVKPDIGVTFVDPREEPKLVQAAGVRVNGELVIEYNGKRENLTALSEQSLVNALTRLARGGERLVMALDGHGERRLDGIANHDLGEFGKQLAAQGFTTNSLNLGIAPEVPANASVLVVANPQVDLQPAEVEKIRDHLQKGGNLLWLVDPEPLRGLQPIAELLGIVLGPGTVVDPEATRFNASPAMAVGAAYGRHPVTDNFRLNTVFPFARQVGVTDAVRDAKDWRPTRLVEVAPRGWIEMGKLDQTIDFDKARDVPGPVTIAVALERNVEGRAQRVVVVGSGAFLSNTFLGNGGNLDFGVNIVNWLAGDDSLITLQPRPTIDSGLELGQAAQYLILIGFLIALPLALIVAGVYIWWRRKRL